MLLELNPTLCYLSLLMILRFRVLFSFIIQICILKNQSNSLNYSMKAYIFLYKNSPYKAKNLYHAQYLCIEVKLRPIRADLR